MRRRSKPLKDKVLKLSTIFEEVISEVFDSVIPTEYEDIKEHGFNVYRFKTNNGFSYDMEFHFGGISLNTKLENSKTFSDYFNGYEGFAGSIDLGFTRTETEKKDEPEDYNTNTNRYEHIELMGRIVFLIKDFMKKFSTFNMFVIGHDTHPVKLEIYKKIISTHFSNDFLIIDGESKYYNNGATYCLNKKMFK